MKIIKVHKVIQKRHLKQNWVWKKLHLAKMFFCKHSIEPTSSSVYSYYSNKTYGECINCDALCEIEET